MTVKFEFIIIFMCQEILYFRLFPLNLLKIRETILTLQTVLKLVTGGIGSTDYSLSTLVLAVFFSGAKIRQLFEESLRRV